MLAVLVGAYGACGGHCGYCVGVEGEGGYLIRMRNGYGDVHGRRLEHRDFFGGGMEFGT